MSKTGLIYEIVCNETYERYVGSTFEPTVARRMVWHRQKKATCSSKQIIDRNNYSYGLLETVMVDTRDELRMYERKWYDTLDCINKNRPFMTKEERKEQIKKDVKKYRENHQEQVNLANKKYSKAYRLKQKALKNSALSQPLLEQL